MTDPIRAALERLLARLDETTDPNAPVPAWSDSYLAARAELAKTAPPADREVTDEDLDGIFEKYCEYACEGIPVEAVQVGDFNEAARAAIALALDRSRRAPVPPAEGEAKDEPPVPISAHDLATQWNQQADGFNQWDSLDLGEQLAWAQARAIALDRSRRAQPVQAASVDLAVRPLLEQVARMGDCIGANTVGTISAISDRAASWLRENPPGQPVAIEPRGCPIPGACSCVEPQPVAVGERLPGPDDCDAEGRCWWHGEGADMIGWTLDAEGGSYYRAKFWLPAHALPTPPSENV